MKIRVIATLLTLGMVALVAPATSRAQTPTHPFMIVREDQYSSLRARATQEPWAGMKQDAIADCQALSYLDANNQPPVERWKSYRVRDIASACSLAYILDDPNKTNYRQKLISTFDLAWPDIRSQQIAVPMNYEYQPPAASAFLNTVLALDIIHDDLTSTELTRQESYMSDQFIYFSTSPLYFRYPPMGAAVATAWLLYKKNESLPANPSCDPQWECCTNLACWKDLYKNGWETPIALDGILTRLSTSGVYTEGSLYGYTAFSHIRDDRTYLIDILEFTGEDNTLYSDPKLAGVYEWLYGYAASPNGLTIPFGDSSDFQSIYDIAEEVTNFVESPRIASAGKFSSIAGQSAMWRYGNRVLPGRLLHYVLLPSSLPAATSPPSRIFRDGGAFFLEPNATQNSLYGALWNVNAAAADSFHKHKDVNAVTISGYGEPLLLNVGFCGTGNDCTQMSFDVVSNRAVSNNTGLINYTIGSPTSPSTVNDHQSKAGGFVIEGFTNPIAGFDYALGDSGQALPNGTHLRSLIFVHPQNNQPGYFATLDQLTPSDGSTRVNLAFHPHTDNPEVITANTEYLSRPGPSSDPNIVSNATARLAIFLATPPISVDLVPGILAHWLEFNQFSSYTGQYLFNTYTTAANQTKQIWTILFPFDSTHPKPSFTRLSGTGYTGATINFPNSITDTLVEANSTQAQAIGTTTFRAAAVVYRQQNAQNVFYFAKQATGFQNNNVGFNSGTPITVHLKGTQGSIISPGTQVVFTYPGITGVKLNGDSITVIPVTEGVQATIPAGTYNLELVAATSPSPTPPPATDLDGDNDTDLRDLLQFLGFFGGTGQGDFNNSGRVDVFDFSLLVGNFGR
ncbi:hypothetical protein A2783_04410 [Microgenomates group bacterium RIFCSPHIGHO2_01_FULL_45_11]|nr:MAG: hypothetical protein A2783_04410 [Microgenomates group bacterium RIFCSPHIGHO2_01_FULL_45_11]